jgi:hypothetical protein
VLTKYYQCDTINETNEMDGAFADMGEEVTDVKICLQNPKTKKSLG